ncbi:hypothetical protein KAM429_09390 [Aquipseudomonas alcaligenes]|uniref:Uncharacterized protein n=1 Tax=Aquipseudomonas alcaligenes TaxID=43263 RepID=A0AA37CEF4_AQUAC|nr:hypothetical protein KAM426_40870 [Pseudomonas alcaligenes]GIZ65844.1 hypothetical protein KAM428_09290 [Pseudomonas alcaligenes]GIZ70178.1 hypothetical protein KAM429_09390 [Pseudomonas alcaligenes]GIZ74531.1 hypothetical protein KAM430_09400 [Pseudomonas alcaligenes]GIZ87612.1 hypothetical protein KAM435_09390 [Pseudomonas alcaligenes]
MNVHAEAQLGDCYTFEHDGGANGLVVSVHKDTPGAGKAHCQQTLFITPDDKRAGYHGRARDKEKPCVDCSSPAA